VEEDELRLPFSGSADVVGARPKRFYVTNSLPVRLKVENGVQHFLCGWFLIERVPSEGRARRKKFAQLGEEKESVREVDSASLELS
jgi:hypothetical protein